MENVFVLHHLDLFVVGDHDGHSDLPGLGDSLGNYLDGVLNTGRSAAASGLAASTAFLTCTTAGSRVALARGLRDCDLDLLLNCPPGDLSLDTVVDSLARNVNRIDDAELHITVTNCTL